MNDAPERCACGRAWGHGTRFGPGATATQVLVDWEGCGAEWPKLYPDVETCERGHPTAFYRYTRQSGRRRGDRYCRGCAEDARAILAARRRWVPA